MDYSDKTFNCARRRGYITFEGNVAPVEWEKTFVGQWVKKYGNRLKELDQIRAIVNNGNKQGRLPLWSDLTAETLKAYKEDVLSRECANSAHTDMNRLKAIISYMKDEVEIPCKRYAEILTCKMQDSQSVYLNENEIKRLEEVVINNEVEQYVKCLFLLETYCSARHSDVLLMTEDNIVTVDDEDGEEMKYVSYVSKKTDTQADIPLHRNFESCLKGYNRDLEVSDMQFNDTLRLLCKRAGINKQTKIFRRGKWETAPKYEFITTHTGRKSFCSNLYMRGVDVRTISKMSGHSNSTITEKTYIVPIKKVSSKAMGFFN